MVITIPFNLYCALLNICILGVKVVCCFVSFVFFYFWLDNESKIVVCMSVAGSVILSLGFRSYCRKYVFSSRISMFHSFYDVEWFRLKFSDYECIFTFIVNNSQWKNFWECLTLLPALYTLSKQFCCKELWCFQVKCLYYFRNRNC